MQIACFLLVWVTTKRSRMCSNQGLGSHMVLCRGLEVETSHKKRDVHL